MKKIILIALACLGGSGCAIMHHVQFGEIDSKAVKQGRRFEVMVSEIGISTAEAGQAAKALARSSNDQQNIQAVQNIVSLFQMGPRTGNQVYNDAYADKIFDLLRKECPSGDITGLMSVRETAKYPVVSGEIVKIVGYCES